jgi:hypothetical protein
MLRDLERCGLELVRGQPELVPGAAPAPRGALFQPGPRGSALDHWLVQAFGSRSRMLIARRPARPDVGSVREPELEKVRSST